MRKQQAEWHQRNKENRSVYNKEWRRKNPDKVREGRKIYWEKSGGLRRVGSEMRRCIKNHPKASRYWEKRVGYTLEDLMARLESQFRDGMSWDNHGEWHIDHKRPISSFEFDSYSDEQFKECWALSNLQPLWAKDNLSKGSKYELEAL